MDILSHGLWGATILRDRKFVWWASPSRQVGIWRAFLSGMMPDLLGRGGGFVYLLSIGEFWGRGTWYLLPEWAKVLYAFHHSFLSVTVYFVLLMFLVPGYRLLIVPYLFHVVVDAFVHTNDSIDRLLYPFSINAGIHRLNWWEHWWIMAMNVGGLIIINVIFIIRSRQ